MKIAGSLCGAAIALSGNEHAALAGLAALVVMLAVAAAIELATDSTRKRTRT